MYSKFISGFLKFLVKTYNSKLFGSVDNKSCVDGNTYCMSFVHLMFFSTEYSSKYRAFHKVLRDYKNLV
jgi:hypothetical protein